MSEFDTARRALLANGALLLGFGSPRITSIPLKFAPTTVPTIPEKGPRIPCLYVPIFFKFKLLTRCANTI